MRLILSEKKIRRNSLIISHWRISIVPIEPQLVSLSFFFFPPPSPVEWQAKKCKNTRHVRSPAIVIRIDGNGWTFIDTGKLYARNGWKSSVSTL